MVSAFQDEQRGFGVVISAEELVTVNSLRRGEGRLDLETTPGTRFLVHGKNKEGYWGYVQFEEQVVDVMDVLEALYPNHQLMIEVGHSAGHAKYREDGLHVGNMNVRFGGKQRALRDTVMVEGCLGPGQAKMYLNRGMWSTQFIEGATARTLDLKPKLGEVQTMSFGPYAPPPFYACDAPISDVRGRGVRDKRTKRSPREGGGGGNGGAESEIVRVIREGYVGKAKGRKQDLVLWERGWFVDGMSTAATVAPEMNIDIVLGNLPDVKNERTALQHLVESRGHILLLSPKFHPEVAGVGIEYSRGMSKQMFRRKFNDEIPKNLHRNMVASMCTETILTVQRVRRFARARLLPGVPCA